MAAPVRLQQSSAGKWGAVCGGCLQHSPMLDVAADDDAWAQLVTLGWTAFQYDQWSRAYAKCPACSTKPTGQVPRRKHRHHR